ncbi:MAG: phosphatidylglycerol lysyltransferase domain-containing protein [Candidatus Omnitrophota bacterium]|nr:phosphatidylglycerol lysyltransferase domain-containing protein [Candidatus Omnitrophota bacterium]
MRLNKLKLSDKKLFDKYLSLEKHELSVYAFANIYIWRKFFDIRWLEIEKSLCVFFQDKIGSFLYLSPLSKANNPQVACEALSILDRLNKNPEFAHIENIEEQDLSFYKGLGLSCELKSYDYLCSRADLARLKGSKFKSKRSSYNYFIKHYDFRYAKFTLSDQGDCLKLYDLWQGQRQSASPDHLYQGMLDDSRISLNEALENYSTLGFQGGVVRINKEIKGFTFGFALNPETFCILYEITDLSIKGLAQFIFRSFTQELKNYKFINIMDDSGLENLKKVKLSYHPVRLVPAYIARRRVAEVSAVGDTFLSRGS